MSHPETVIVGRLGAVYGIKGWLKVNSFTEQAEAIFEYSSWMVGKDGQFNPVEVTEWRRHNHSLIVKLSGFDAREQSQTLTGLEIAVAAEQLPELAEDEFYWRDLLGMRVVNRQGYDLGKVTDLMETGSNDVLVVKANLKDAFGKKERLIPFVESQMVDSVDQCAQIITVDWDPGF
ncbi:ribosome maturation factor RimM [Celerinatantimonas diazotrophica]|uniref:Ribosome maturation factor RimM n=1 Tax=Celerinatantimonas diazotrophica TaxID=412034 RepID=A0A4R1J9C9_9GAMM|nr:ribosome maturation factor RimM [Celerinatantimonas diazotrophica]TCK47024.1 16S rRNA processing protein RimM [Celerinatantimonas diazotrophica]CAG9295792.1 Ribosome maturation factor RimM [Celerinatantimonas diazotrophica]